MKFDELDRKMRVYETAHDHCVLPGLFIVARIDGRSFTRLTKEVLAYEAPFDVRFRDAMVRTTEHLMNAGFRIVFGYTESDEISLLLHPGEALFNRKERKINSVLAGEASAFFSLAVGTVAAFDCRVVQLPGVALVTEYFRWRNEDAHRNALSAHCYWALRKEGLSARKATSQTDGLSYAEKNELLFARGINFNNLPSWQKRGVGLYWQTVHRTGRNPLTGAETPVIRKELQIEYELPMQEAYSEFIANLVQGLEQEEAR